jgi:hypothetical protein
VCFKFDLMDGGKCPRTIQTLTLYHALNVHCPLPPLPTSASHSASSFFPLHLVPCIAFPPLPSMWLISILVCLLSDCGKVSLPSRAARNHAIRPLPGLSASLVNFDDSFHVCSRDCVREFAYFQVCALLQAVVRILQGVCELKCPGLRS